MRALRQCDSGGGGGGGYGSYLCTRHRRDATVSSAVLRSPRRVAEARGGAPIAARIPRSVLVEPKIPLTFGNLYIHILPCGEAFSFRYFSSLEGLYWHVDEDVHTTQDPCTHTHVTSDPRAGAAVVAIGVGSPVAQPAKPLASSSASRRTWGGGGGKRGPHSAQPVTSSWAPGPPPSQSPFRGVRGHSDHAVLDADRHRGRRPARMWDAVLALGAVDAFCVRSAGCVVAEGESEVSRRAYWRAPRRERKRSHSTPPSRDYGGVERRQCRGAQQLARRSSLKSMSAQKAPAAASRADRQTRRHLRLRAQARQAILPSSATPAPADRQRRTADHGPNGPRTTDQKPIRPRNRKIPNLQKPLRGPRSPKLASWSVVRGPP